MIRRLSRYLTCPPRLLSDDSRPVQLPKFIAKSLIPEILTASPMGSRFCGAPPVFSRSYGPQGGGGYTRLPHRGLRWRRVCAVPGGTLSFFPQPSTPPSAPCWAVITRACGAPVCQNSSSWAKLLGFFKTQVLPEPGLRLHALNCCQLRTGRRS